MTDVLNHLRKTGLYFGHTPDKSQVDRQIAELQGVTPPLQSSGGPDGASSLMQTLLAEKNKKQQDPSYSGDGEADFQYRGEHPTTKSDGLDSVSSMSDLGSSVNKISNDKAAKEVGKSMSMTDVKGKSTMPTPRGTKVLLRTPASVKLSAFMGGVLRGFEKAGSRPEVDPGMMFDSIVRRLPTEATPEEQAEIKAAFVENW